MATASIDISDGLIADLHHLCAVSRLSAIIEMSRVPLSPAAQAAIGRDRRHLARVLTGGGDYEILFTASLTAADQLAEMLRTVDVPVTAIGRVSSLRRGEEPRVTVLGDGGLSLKLESEGRMHFCDSSRSASGIR